MITRARFVVSERVAVLLTETVTSKSLCVGESFAIGLAVTSGVDGQPVTPTSLTLTVKRRDCGDPAVTYTLEDGELDQLDESHFRLTVPCTTAGTFDYVWRAVGPLGAGVKPGYFVVSPAGSATP